MWPEYSRKCRKDVDDLLRRGGSLSAYRANPLFPSWTGPQKGSWAERLERDIERKFRVRHAVAVNSGTAALHAALASLSLKPGEEVVTTPYSFSATASAIVLSGGTPVFADVDPETYCLSKETVKDAVTKRTRAVLPVHLFGHLVDVRSLGTLGLPTVEDACQAVGARGRDGYSGTAGIAGAYSLNGGKNAPAGEAGVLVTNDDAVSEAARLFVNHAESFYQKSVGVNYRMNEITACVAWHGIQELETRNKRRQDIVKAFLRALDVDEIVPFKPKSPESNVHYVYPFRIKPPLHRSVFLAACQRKGLSISGGYVTPTLEKYPAFLKYARKSLPVVTELSERTLCLINSFTPDQPIEHGAEVARKLKEVVGEIL